MAFFSFVCFLKELDFFKKSFSHYQAFNSYWSLLFFIIQGSNDNLLLEILDSICNLNQMILKKVFIYD